MSYGVPAAERREASGRGVDGRAYDAFISYSRAADGNLAPALQRGLRSLAKPWYRRRALRIFLDRTSLSATPELWPTIERGLESSDAFVLLASPDAAASPWVEQEVAWWRAHRGSDTCLVVLTDGSLAWDAMLGDFDAESAVPPSLRQWFDAEPGWVDLRWARTETHVSLRNPRFRDCVAEVAAPLRDMPKDALVGEDIRQHRRATRLAWTAATLLVLLTAAAIVGAVLARNQAALATARQVAATADSVLDSRLDLAQGLAAEAYARRRTSQATAALFAAVSTSPQLVRTASNGSRITAVAPSPTDAAVYVGDERGRVRRWDLGSGRLDEVPASTPGAVTALAVTSTRLAAGAVGAIVVHELGTARTQRLASAEAVASLAVDDTGRWVAASTFATGSAQLVLYDLRSGRVVRSVQDTEPAAVLRFTGGDRLFSGYHGSYGAEAATRTVPALDLVGRREVGGNPGAGDYTPAFTTHGTFYGFHKFGSAIVADTRTGERVGSFQVPYRAVATAMAVSPDAARVAVAAAGTISVASPMDAPAGQTGGLVVDPLTGISARVTSLAFVGGHRRLVSAAGDVLALWDLDQVSRLARRLPANLPDETTAEFRPVLAFDAVGRRIVWGNEDGGVLGVSDVASGRVLRRIALPDVGSPLWAGAVMADRDTALLANTDALFTVDLRTGRYTTAPLPGTPGSSGSPARLLPGSDGRGLVVYSDGRIVAGTAGSQRFRQIVGPLRPTRPYVDYLVDAAVAAETGDAFVSITGRLWHARATTGRGAPWPRLGGDVTAVAVSSDGRHLVTADGESTVRLWDVRAREVVRTLDAGPVEAVALSPDAEHVVTITRDGAMSIWLRDTGARLGEVPIAPANRGIMPKTGGQTTLLFDRDGRLWTATSGGPLVAWRATPASWLETACATLGRPLTRDEWQRYVGTAYDLSHECHGALG